MDAKRIRDLKRSQVEEVECYTDGQFKNQWYLVAILSTENTRVFVVWTILQLSNKDKGGGAGK